MTRTAKIALLMGAAGVLLGLVLPAAGLWWVLKPLPPREPLSVRMDDSGPYVILATSRSAESYAAAIRKALALHPGAERVVFEPDDLDAVPTVLRRVRPRYALVFVQPDELDVNFAWQWLTMTSRIDADPFVDVRTGFITGATPEAAEAFMERITAAAAGRLVLPGVLVDNLGPPEQGGGQYFNAVPRAVLVPVLEQRLTARSISHGPGSFTDERLGSMDGAGLVHFGGHGHPDGIDDGLTAAQVPGLKLAPSIVFNGACYTGVTHRWFDLMGGQVRERTVAPADSFCLRLLEKDVVGYLAAVHPDHGMPVYQEMEFLAWAGAPLGDVIKHTWDGVVLGAGGQLPEFRQLADGMPSPGRTPAEFMLQGTAARILLGDPALVVGEAFTPAPFSIAVAEQEGALQVTATLMNPALRSTLTDTYHNDLNPQAPFNDRALLVFDLPQDWNSVEDVDVVRVTAQGTVVPYRLVGHAVEEDQGLRRLHVQVDVPADGFQQSAFRVAGATVELVVRRADSPETGVGPGWR